MLRVTIPRRYWPLLPQLTKPYKPLEPPTAYKSPYSEFVQQAERTNTRRGEYAQSIQDSHARKTVSHHEVNFGISPWAKLQRFGFFACGIGNTWELLYDFRPALLRNFQATAANAVPINSNDTGSGTAEIPKRGIALLVPLSGGLPAGCKLLAVPLARGTVTVDTVKLKPLTVAIGLRSRGSVSRRETSPFGDVGMSVFIADGPVNGVA